MLARLKREQRGPFLVWFFKAIFVDPVTARFEMFYLPGLLFLIAVALAYKPPETGTKATPQHLHRRSLSAWVAGFGNALANRLAAADITPNQITFLGLALVAINAVLYLFHRNSFWFGLGLALSFLFDALDGLVARRQGTVSKYGGFLDAMVDRYQEIVTYLVIGIVTHWWAVIFFITTGSMLTSYNKARVAIEMPVDNKGWPDLLIRHRRLWILCFGLMADSSVPWMLHFVLASLAVMTHYTAAQRYFRARTMFARIKPSANCVQNGGS